MNLKLLLFPSNIKGSLLMALFFIAEKSIKYTLEPHYKAHFGVHSDMSVITEQPYNEGLIHWKYKQWEPCL